MTLHEARSWVRAACAADKTTEEASRVMSQSIDELQAALRDMIDNHAPNCDCWHHQALEGHTKK